MTSRSRAIAIVVGSAVAAASLTQWLRPKATRQRPGVTIVDGVGRLVPTARTPMASMGSTEPSAPTEPMINEAPPALRSLHAGVERSRDPASAIKEENVAALFAGDAALGATDVTVHCSPDRCEVHGIAADDESGARMAMGGDAFLDRLLAAGYSAGMNMVSGRTQGGSEFVIYLEPR